MKLLLLILPLVISFNLPGPFFEPENRESGPRRRRLQAEAAEPPGEPDVVVAQDGSGNFETIKEALEASVKRENDDEKFVIYIKAGIYEEYLVVSDDMKNVMLLGDGIGNTIITGSHCTMEGIYRTWNASTVVVVADGFVGRDITFQNTAGPSRGQAPAITVNSDQAAFYRCSFEGYQDTLYAKQGDQFYRDCDIYGTVDFVFGNATAIFQRCNIYVRKPPGNEAVIAASSRDSAEATTGLVFQSCHVMAAPELQSVVDSYKIYLGRPWKPYARTVYIKNDLDIPIDPSGWLEWENRSDARTVDYREFNNRGIGSATGGRVGWPGYRVMKGSREAEEFTVRKFLKGDEWLPATGVMFHSGL
ncbi:pectinesterase-like [Diospyros lotus]|uniref:pectinesterase-like n=1 Tax=Diospyros lotus TaxID=55363 RepID=UPI0022539F03|nr:pectinesterase-like [Diospyros lotus]